MSDASCRPCHCHGTDTLRAFKLVCRDTAAGSLGCSWPRQMVNVFWRKMVQRLLHVAQHKLVQNAVADLLRAPPLFVRALQAGHCAVKCNVV